MSVDAELVELARRVVDENRVAGRRIATAESCTGGLVAAALTEVAGASDVFDRSFITYSNEAKTEMLGVSDDILATLGAVSEATAWAMAQGALKRSTADIAIAISGIAGPGGGSDKKPVGTVVFARALRDEAAGPVLADTHHFGDLGRAEIRRQAALVGLRLLLP
jgi:nicotinamide-nucleotide amidase